MLYVIIMVSNDYYDKVIDCSTIIIIPILIIITNYDDKALVLHCSYWLEDVEVDCMEGGGQVWIARDILIIIIVIVIVIIFNITIVIITRIIRIIIIIIARLHWPRFYKIG